MTKKEFLKELEEALAGNLPSQEIEENLRYYDSYFAEQSASETEVCEELGDPRLIARTLIDSFEASKGPMKDYYREQARDEYSNQSRQEEAFEQSRGKEHWYERIFRYLMLFLVVVIGGAVLLFVLRVAIYIVLPIILLVIIAGFLMRLFR